MYVIYVRTVCMCAHTARHGLAHCLLRTSLFLFLHLLTKQMTAVPPLPPTSSTSITTAIPTDTHTIMITAYRRE